MTSLHAGPQIEIGDLKLTVIEKTTLHGQLMKRGILLGGSKEPYAVLVQKAATASAMGMDGVPIATSQFVEWIPEL